MSRPTRRGRPVKRKLSEADISDSDHDQQSNQDNAPEFDEVVHDDFEVQPNQARHETTTTPNINVIRRPGGKRQKFTQPDSEFDNEFAEIEYVDKSRHSFSKKNGLTGDLPPIHDIEQIFEQITLHAVQTPGFYNLLDALNGRELRVATVCSGTESPILALEMVVSALKKLGVGPFSFKHLFSAEIVEFKQAYIERNFRPPLIFRDVVELNRKFAHTAYGAKKKVPTHVDLLVAGFPCVDYSNLNNWRKKFGERGESNDTLRGLVAYCEIHRPKIIILENIYHAPWKDIRKAFETIEYHILYVKVDTKDFYIPQTRERGYALCIDRRLVENGDALLNKWSEVFSSFERRASSPFTDFIDPDDEVIEQRKLERAAEAEPKSSHVWSLYKIRHADVRRETEFGTGKPITHWEEGGTCCPATWMDRPWFFSQVERVWDTIDLNHLRTLSEFGYDNTSKVRCNDVSQGVDRDTDAKAFGILGCVTPSGILYSTARGGQIQGRELLSMQGLPLNRLSLTRESQSQIQDLAGNAMSSTVVGPAMLAALMVCHSALKVQNKEQLMLDIDDHVQESMPAISLVLSQMQNMRMVPQANPTVNWYQGLRRLAALTASLCSCEGPHGVGRYGLYLCRDCKFTACAACTKNPIHNYCPIPVGQLRRRRLPKEFREELLSRLPAHIQPPKLPELLFQPMSEYFSTNPNTANIWKQYLETVAMVCQDILNFKCIKRRHNWTVIYDGAHSALQLTIDARGMHWNLFAKAADDMPARSYFREAVRHPIARMEVSPQGSSLLEGEWRIFGPLSKKDIEITLQGAGGLFPSYENSCGLPKFANQTVWRYILVDGDDEAVNKLSLDIRGKYERIPNCGGSLQSLHRRIPQQPGTPNLYFFLDPRRLGPQDLDAWVFSTDPYRKSDDSQREIVLQLDSKWSYEELRRQDNSYTSSVLASHRRWLDAGPMSLIDCDPAIGFSSSIRNAGTTLQLNNSRSCYDCYIPLQSTSVNVTGARDEDWAVVETSKFQGMKNLAWTWARFSVWSPCENWTSVGANFEVCSRCYPRQPDLAWKTLRGRERPIEDPEDAARCERDFKLRPSPFCLFQKMGSFTGEMNQQRREVCLALNIKTMLHRACGAISHRRDNSTIECFYWRVTSNDDTDIALPGSYRILNNNHEPRSGQPPHFKIQLRPDQLRSLRWVLSRESDDQVAFPEEEVEEAIWTPLEWRAEAKVIVHRKIKGGILADHVGFGKTAVVLGLIDVQHEKDVLEAEEPCDNAIPLKATCIVVPDVLFDQWLCEIRRFLGRRYTVLGIEGAKKLRLTPIRAFRSADIVLVSSTAFASASYFKKLEENAGGPCPPKSTYNMRMVDAWFEDVLGSIEAQVQVLKSDGPEAFLEAIHLKYISVWGTDAYNRYLPSRKLAGKKGGQLRPDDDHSTAPEVAEEVAESSINSSPPQKKPSSSEPKDLLSFGIVKGQKISMDDVKNTVFHMYRFQRLVIDEFTYLNQDRRALLASLKARSRWIMSGTPPIKGFASAEGMARLLNVYLGKPCDDDYEKGKYQRSESENFHFFREVKSKGWHFRRNGVAQQFCDFFMRQNTPNIPPIKWTVHYQATTLTAVERVLYLELKLFYDSYNPNTKGEKMERYSYDQRGRISEIVDSCSTPEQSLIKRSSSYNVLPEWSSAGERIDTAKKLVSLRRKEALKILREITIEAKAIAWLAHQVCQVDTRFEALKASLNSNDYGDTDVSRQASEILENAIGSYREDDWKAFWVSAKRQPVKAAGAVADFDDYGDGDGDEGDDGDGDDSDGDDGDGDAGDDIDDTQDEETANGEEGHAGHEVDASSEYVPLSQRQNRPEQHLRPVLRPLPVETADIEKELRGRTNRFRVNVLALVERARALRFAESAYDFQDRSVMPECQSCEQSDPRSQEIHSVLGKCGHIVCPDCLEKVLANRKCIVGDCRAAVNNKYVIPGCHFAMCRPISMPTPPGGTKVDSLVKLLKDETSIPKGDQVILFLQFPDLQGMVTEAFDVHNITYVSLGCSGPRGGRNRVKTFAGTSDIRVAILQLGTENAAGLNLQNANHVIFFAPFAAKNHYEYQSTITQSSGRAIRFGQDKEVHIWNMVTLNTLEVGVLQEQDGRILVRRKNGEYKLVLEYEVKGEDEKGFEVPSFDWK